MERAAMKIPSDLYPHQKTAVEKMHNGCILVGGVGTGKSRTSLAYYVAHECDGDTCPPLYIITTARKRDTKDWEKECEPFEIVPEAVDSWNNIPKYVDVKGAFFIFDEQRVVGKGVWVKSFIKICRGGNHWVLLSATPGDTWMDYVPVLVANGYYRNRTDFIQRHVIYSRMSKYPKVERYIGTADLMRMRKEIVVNMPFMKKTVAHDEWVDVPFDKEMVKLILSTRWNPYEDEPIQDAGGLCHVLRHAVNSDMRRIEAVERLLEQHPKAVIFYNFNFELEMLKNMAER
ncbi:MAG: DEAD/DEAH box helicase family protein, partial [Lachnospiraceae bacterium]|nr:DEAD/DEAH box helicase family protein [Lachnospiraceae bacterium]